MAWSTVLVALGSALVIVSTVVTGYLLARIDRTREELEEAILAEEESRRFGVEYMQYSNIKSYHAQTLLALLQCTNPPDDITRRWFKELVSDILGSITDRSSAATGEAPSDELMEHWIDLAAKAEAADPSAFDEFSKTSAELLVGWVERNNELVKERDRLTFEKARLQRRSDRDRLIAIALQVMGLILVLVADLTSG
jgi:hypothetical protein